MKNLLFTLVITGLCFGLAGCNGERARLEAAKVREIDESAPPAAATPAGSGSSMSDPHEGHGHEGHDHAGHDHSDAQGQASAQSPEAGQAVAVESHDHKMDPRLKEKPSAKPAHQGDCCKEGSKAGHKCEEGSDECAGSASSKESAEAGSASANCTCAKDKPTCKCGHCSGAIDTCHCRHAK